MPAVRALDATSKRRELRGLDRRAVASASPPPRHSPATAPCLMSEDADQTPLGNETGCDQDKAALEGGDKFFSALKLRENFEKAASRCPAPPGPAASSSTRRPAGSRNQNDEADP